MEIPAELCVAGRDLTEPKLAPDGSIVTFVARGPGGPAAVIAVPAGGGPERLVTTVPVPAPGRGLGGGCYAWMPAGNAIVYAAIDGELWWQPVPGGAPRPLTGADGSMSARAPSPAPDGSCVAYQRDDVEIRAVVFDSAADRRLDDGPADHRLDDGGDDFVFDPYVALVRDGVATVRWLAWSVPDMPWDGALVREVDVALADGSVLDRRTTRSDGAMQQPRGLPDGRLTCVRDDAGWLNVWVDGLYVAAEPAEHAGPTWGPGQRSYATSPTGAAIAFTRNEDGFGRLCVVDLESGQVSDVARGVHGQLDWRGDRVVALRTGARTPTQVVVYDDADPSGRGWERRTLAVGPALGWEAFDLPEPEMFEVSHQGRAIPARRYTAGQGRMLCWIHGGPTDQWQVEFMPRVAYWWSRGWDVLVPDPRGTTGHGRDHQQALHGGWGEADVDDTAAVVAHAHREGWALPATTVAVGGSSGGLTALGLLGFHATLVAGGVAVYPVCDLADLAERSHRFEAHYALTLVGDPDRDRDRYVSRSPLSYADRIRLPLLLLHGEDDPVVPVDQSVRLAERVRAAGGDVELHVFEGEGHGFRDVRNKLAEYELMGLHLGRILARSAGHGSDRSAPGAGPTRREDRPPSTG